MYIVLLCSIKLPKGLTFETKIMNRIVQESELDGFIQCVN